MTTLWTPSRELWTPRRPSMLRKVTDWVRMATAGQTLLNSSGQRKLNSSGQQIVYDTGGCGTCGCTTNGTIFCSGNGTSYVIDGVSLISCVETSGSYTRTAQGAAFVQPWSGNMAGTGSGFLGGSGAVNLYGNVSTSNGTSNLEYLAGEFNGNIVQGVGYGTQFFWQNVSGAPGTYPNQLSCGAYSQSMPNTASGGTYTGYNVVGTGGTMTISNGMYGVDISSLPSSLSISTPWPPGAATSTSDCYYETGGCSPLDNPSTATAWDGTFTLSSATQNCIANPNFVSAAEYDSSIATGSWGGYQFNGARITLLGSNPVQFILALYGSNPPISGSGCATGGRSFLGFSPTVTGSYIGYLSCMGAMTVS